MPIAKLPLLLVNQIAAGEVIERPASVVKELVENSLDAGATRVEVTIEEGGRQLIRISDDGIGIPEDELPLALAPHATSKLQLPEQLASVGTLGFRGEALASIASISRLRVTSRARVGEDIAESAAVIEAAGETVSPVAPASGAPGTVVEARDLFFNTPARRKFMRTPASEFGHISDTVSRIAMAWPQKGFKLIHNGRTVFDLPPNQPPRVRCVELLGHELDEALLGFDTDHVYGAAAQLWGLAGVPSIGRATSKFQYVCLNGRPIRDRQIAHAMREAYRGLLPPDRHPVVVLFIEVDPALVDVNVHPAKFEVRFHDASAMHGLVLSTLRQRLLGADLTPVASFNSNTPASTLPSLASHPQLGEGGTPVASSGLLASTAAQPTDAASFVEYFRRMDPKQKGMVYDEVRRDLEERDPAAPLPNFGDASEGVRHAPAPSSILQVHKSYLVTQDDQGILIVDQHALHERIMFEDLVARVSQSDLESQRLLMPATIEASPKRQAVLEQLQPLLQRIGIEAGPVGPQNVAIHAFPTFLFDKKVEPGKFLNHLLDQVEEGQLDVGSSTSHEAALHKVLDMMACKAAVKAGDQMQPGELEALLQRRAQIERSSNCPHGRPTSIRLSLRDLEKQFKRT